MIQCDVGEATGVPPVARGLDDETELARCAGAGDEQAFDLLYDRYFARTSRYFTIFARREAKAAVQDVLTELFGSLTTPSDRSLAERAYRLARATELRIEAVRKDAKSMKAASVKVEMVINGEARTLVPQVQS